MELDSDTAIAMLAMLSLASGVLLLVIGRGAGDVATAVLWGLANLFVAMGVVILWEETSPALAFLCLMLATALMWASMAAFNDRSVPPIFLICGALVWIGVAYAPGLDLAFGEMGAIYLAICALFLVGAAAELWRGRSEKLPARWPLLALIALDAVAVGFAVTQIASLDEISPGTGEANFWPVYLAAILFNVGSTALVISLIKERVAARSRAAAETDTLTGLPNRGAAFDAANKLLEKAHAEDRPVGVVIFDLDRFKSINDGYGHQMGDTVLRAFAEALTKGVRPKDLVGRIGGEEFIAVAPGASAEAAVAIADRVRKSFAAAVDRIGDSSLRATVSAGVAVVEPGEGSVGFDGALNRADAALYDSKSAGRNRVSVASGSPGAANGNLVQLA